MGFYFDKFEHRRPPEPVPHNPTIEFIWQSLAVIALVLGANLYLLALDFFAKLRCLVVCCSVGVGRNFSLFWFVFICL